MSLAKVVDPVDLMSSLTKDELQTPDFGLPGLPGSTLVDPSSLDPIGFDGPSDFGVTFRERGLPGSSASDLDGGDLVGWVGDRLGTTSEGETWTPTGPWQNEVRWPTNHDGTPGKPVGPVGESTVAVDDDDPTFGREQGILTVVTTQVTADGHGRSTQPTQIPVSRPVVSTAAVKTVSSQLGCELIDPKTRTASPEEADAFAVILQKGTPDPMRDSPQVSWANVRDVRAATRTPGPRSPKSDSGTDDTGVASGGTLLIIDLWNDTGYRAVHSRSSSGPRIAVSYASDSPSNNPVPR